MHFIKKFALIFFLAPFAFIQAEVEEVIVTANKKVETVQEIPMNISVITEVDIQELDKYDIIKFKFHLAYITF